MSIALWILFVLFVLAVVAGAILTFMFARFIFRELRYAFREHRDYYKDDWHL